jgi:hypothetical protein
LKQIVARGHRRKISRKSSLLVWSYKEKEDKCRRKYDPNPRRWPTKGSIGGSPMQEVGGPGEVKREEREETHTIGIDINLD